MTHRTASALTATSTKSAPGGLQPAGATIEPPTSIDQKEMTLTNDTESLARIGEEVWRLPSGRIARIDLDQPLGAIEVLRESLSDAGAMLEPNGGA